MKPIIIVARALIEEDGKILLLRRSLQDKHRAGLWEVPGGKCDPGEQLEDATVRETKEETGIIVKVKTLNFFFISCTNPKDSKRYPDVVFINMFSVCQWVSGTMRLSHEHGEMKLISPHESLSLDLVPETRAVLTKLVS